MKKIIGFVFLAGVLIAVMAFSVPKPVTMHSLEGTWELQHFYSFDGQEITDTVPTDYGYRQVKMYYNGKVMWSRTTLKDTKDADGNNVVGKFGYGTYRITATKLMESIEYGDAGMMTGKEKFRNFEFELWLTDDTYSQITLDEEGNRIFSENYLRID